MGASAPERPRVDHPVDRPELYGLKGLQVTGTNGRLLDRFYRLPFTTVDEAELFPKRFDESIADQNLIIT